MTFCLVWILVQSQTDRQTDRKCTGVLKNGHDQKRVNFSSPSRYITNVNRHVRQDNFNTVIVCTFMYLTPQIHKILQNFNRCLVIENVAWSLMYWPGLDMYGCVHLQSIKNGTTHWLCFWVHLNNPLQTQALSSDTHMHFTVMLIFLVHFIWFMNINCIICGLLQLIWCRNTLWDRHLHLD